MNSKDPKFTVRLEPALRALARAPESKLASLAERHNIDKGDLAIWLGEFNGGNKLLREKRIDEVKAQVGGVVVTRLHGPAAAVPPPVAQKIVGPASDLGKWLEAQKVTLQGTAQAFLVKVTPALAVNWLSLNKGNRNPSKSKIRRFAAAIAAGKWILNGETVKFSISGRLLDGQSRLKAIVEANTSAVLEVRGGLPDRAQESMDTGEARKHAHQLEMLGEKYPNETAAALRIVFGWERGVLGSVDSFSKKVKLELNNTAIRETLERHPGVRASVGRCLSVSKLMPISQAAGLHYLFARANQAKADTFVDRLITGANLGAGNPIFVLREKLIQDRLNQAKIPARVRHALVIKAWNSHFTGRPAGALGELTFVKEEEFPAIAGVTPPKREQAA